MANINIYIGSPKEKDEISETLTQVASLLQLEAYKGPSPSVFIRWLSKQDPQAVASALRHLRQEELKRELVELEYR